MSRLTQPAIQDGDDITAASLNDRFTQFSQTDLNEFNTRDGAFDLPHFQKGTGRFVAPTMYEKSIGWNLWKHSSYHTFTGQTTGVVNPHIVLDSGGSADKLDFGALGMTVRTTDVLRVYWDLSIRPRWEGSKPWLGGALYFTFPNGTGGTTDIFSGYGCWAFWLQWDITDNTLTNWVDVPGQGDFNTVVTGTRGGNALTNCSSTSVMQTNIESCDADDGAVRSPTDVPLGWTSVDGAWHYTPQGANTVIYGIRVVFTGPLGAYNDGANNYLVRNDSVAASARLDQQAGGLSALLMTLG
jgi:hypothetical protein